MVIISIQGGNRLRSIRSWIIERLLKRLSNKDSFTDEKRYAKFLKQIQNENEKSYILLKYIQNIYNIKKQYFKGMKCYTFNYENQSSNKSIIYLHGGGYIKQPLIDHCIFIGKIAKKANVEIYVPIYPKAP